MNTRGTVQARPWRTWPWTELVTFLTAVGAFAAFLWPSDAATLTIAIAVAIAAVWALFAAYMGRDRLGTRFRMTKPAVATGVAMVGVIIIWVTCLTPMIGLGASVDFVARIPAFISGYTLVFVTLLQVFARDWENALPAYLVRITQLMLAAAGAVWVVGMVPVLDHLAR